MSRPQEESPVRSGHVVIIDDDDLVLERVERTLRNTNWTVHCFSDVDDALSHFQQSGMPKVLIVDNLMPKLDGVDLLERLALGPVAEPLELYLWSSVRPPAKVLARVKQVGARILSKDILYDEAAFFDLLDRRSATSA